MGIPTDLAVQDVLEIQSLAYAWAECYDTKDWDRLKKTVLGPVITYDSRYIGGTIRENLSPDEFVAIVSDKKVLGDPLVKTQHLIGAGSWNSLEDGTVQLWWQIRAAHQRFMSLDLAEAVSHGHGHGAGQHTYKTCDGYWKLVGIKVRVDWIEGDLFGTLDPAQKSVNIH